MADRLVGLFQLLNILFHCFLASIVSGKKSAVNHIFVLCDQSFYFCSSNIFLLAFSSLCVVYVHRNVCRNLSHLGFVKHCDSGA